MPILQAGEDVGRGGRHHDLDEELELVEPQDARDVAVVLRDVADADGGVDDDRPDRGDEDDEDRRRAGNRGTRPATAAARPAAARCAGSGRSDRGRASPRSTGRPARRAPRRRSPPGRSRWRRAAARSAPARPGRYPAGHCRRTDRDQVIGLVPHLARRRQAGGRRRAGDLPDDQHEGDDDGRRHQRAGQSCRRSRRESKRRRALAAKAMTSAGLAGAETPSPWYPRWPGWTCLRKAPWADLAAGGAASAPAAPAQAEALIARLSR